MLKLLSQLLFPAIFCLSLISEEVAHNRLGEHELSGIDIYDLLQDREGNFWIATNNGLYKFDGYKIIRKECATAISRSYFNLTKDRKGQVFFNNLSGQIFSIEDDSCLLYYNISDSLISPEISFNFNDSNQLIVLANQVFKVSEDQSINMILNKGIGNLKGLFKKKNGNLLVYDSQEGKFYEININGIEKQYAVNSNYTFTDFFYLEDTFYAFESQKLSLYKLESEKLHKIGFNITETVANKFYSDNKFLWQVSLSGGGQVFDDNLNIIYDGLFPNTIVSAFIKDHEANTLLGTFGQGIIFIPNMNARTILLPEAEKASRIAFNDKGELYVGTRSGRVFSYEKDRGFMQYMEGGKHIECLYYSHGNKCLIVDNSIVKFRFNNGKEVEAYIGAIKDVFEIADRTLIMATDRGLVEVKIKAQKISSRRLTTFDERANSVGYEEGANLYYAGSVQGLKIGTESNAAFFELEKGKPIHSNNILVGENKVFVCTQKYGVLVFKNGEYIEKWDKSSTLLSNNIKEILNFQSGFVILTEKGIYTLDSTGIIQKKIGYAEGLFSTYPFDISVNGNFIYVAHNKGLQYFDSKLIESNVTVPTNIKLQVTVNDNLVETKQENIFDYQQNRISFYLKAPTLKYQAELKYQYQLSAIDKKWHTNAFSANKVEYKSLPPGDYQFSYRTRFRGKTGSVRTFTFTIAKPFWEEWWFYFSIISFILLLVYLSYRVKLNRQAKISRFEKELIASKLKAIQSQMNPHFIFNSLNSIQDLVLRQKGEDAYVYIGKFAYLIRKVLHHSDEEFIELEEELKVLKVYLELEKLRFNQDFKFSILANDLEGIDVPPMLAQPFIENAIKHGLLHKKGRKKLSIQYLLEDEQLHCIIIDNGIGRKEAEKINKRKANHHKSFSVNKIRSQFEILQDLYGDDLSIEFSDLYKNEKAIGTKVDLTIPYRRKY